MRAHAFSITATLANCDILFWSDFTKFREPKLENSVFLKEVRVQFLQISQKKSILNMLFLIINFNRHSPPSVETFR